MTTPRSLLLLACLALLSSAFPAPAPQIPAESPVQPVSMPLPPKAQCFWKSSTFLPQTPPDDLPQVTLDALERWWPFAFENDYRIDVERDGRALVLSDYRERRTRKQMILVENTLGLFDRRLPDEPLGVEESMSTERLAMPVPNAGPVVLVRLRDRVDHGRCLEHLVSLDERLGAWAHDSATAQGFRLNEPSVAAWIVDAPDQEEWREENELVNRLATCLLEGRFGRQPHWLAQGVAWYAELEITDGIYCFPNRAGFVGVAEHSGWDSELRRVFRTRKQEPLCMEELTAWQRGTYDEACAALALGLVSFLIEDCRDPDALENEIEDNVLADIAREMGAHRQTFGVRTHADGSWSTIPDYVLPAEIQRQIVEHHAGEGVWDEVTRSFWMGTRYKPSRMR